MRYVQHPKTPFLPSGVQLYTPMSSTLIDKRSCLVRSSGFVGYLDQNIRIYSPKVPINHFSPVEGLKNSLDQVKQLRNKLSKIQMQKKDPQVESLRRSLPQPVNRSTQKLYQSYDSKLQESVRYPPIYEELIANNEQMQEVTDILELKLDHISRERDDLIVRIRFLESSGGQSPLKFENIPIKKIQTNSKQVIPTQKNQEDQANNNVQQLQKQNRELLEQLKSLTQKYKYILDDKNKFDVKDSNSSPQNKQVQNFKEERDYLRDQNKKLTEQLDRSKFQRDSLISKADKFQDQYNKLNTEKVIQEQRVKLFSMENSVQQIKIIELTQKLKLFQDQQTDSTVEITVNREQIRQQSDNKDKIIQDLSYKLLISCEQSDTLKSQIEEQNKRSALKVDLYNEQEHKIYQLEKANIILQQTLLKLEQQLLKLPDLEHQLEENEQKIKELTNLSGEANQDAKQLQLNCEQLIQEVKDSLILKHQNQLEQLKNSNLKQQDGDSVYIQQINGERQKYQSLNEILQQDIINQKSEYNTQQRLSLDNEQQKDQKIKDKETLIQSLQIQVQKDFDDFLLQKELYLIENEGLRQRVQELEILIESTKKDNILNTQQVEQMYHSQIKDTTSHMNLTNQKNIDLQSQISQFEINQIKLDQQDKDKLQNKNQNQIDFDHNISLEVDAQKLKDQIMELQQQLLIQKQQIKQSTVEKEVQIQGNLQHINKLTDHSVIQNKISLDLEKANQTLSQSQSQMMITVQNQQEELKNSHIKVDYLEGQINQIQIKSLESQEQIDNMVKINKSQEEKIQQLEIQIDEQKSLLSQYKMLSKSQVDDHIDEDMRLMHEHLGDHSPENLVRELKEKVFVINELEKQITILKRESFSTEQIDQFNSSRLAKSAVIPCSMSSSQLRSREETHKLFKQINQKSMRTSGMMSNRLDYTASQKKPNLKIPMDNLAIEK